MDDDERRRCRPCACVSRSFCGASTSAATSRRATSSPRRCCPLARALAGRYAGRGEPLDDLVQVACVGIMKAIDGFDIAREVRFSSYATPTVLGEIKRHFRDKTWSVRVPRGLQELQLQVAKERDKLTNELGRSPTVQELADAIDAPFEEVLATIQSASARRTRSLDEPTGEDVTLADSLGGNDPELDRAEMRALLDGAFGVLSARDREVLRLRFEDDMTQTEIADRIGVSQMQVSRLIRQSLARLRMDIERSPGPLDQGRRVARAPAGAQPSEVAAGLGADGSPEALCACFGLSPTATSSVQPYSTGTWYQLEQTVRKSVNSGPVPVAPPTRSLASNSASCRNL